MYYGEGNEQRRYAGSSYRIRLEGHLPDRYSSWFEPLTARRRTDGITVLEGPVDQPALHALLRKIRDLGLTLVSVERFHPEVEVEEEEGAE